MTAPHLPPPGAVPPALRPILREMLRVMAEQRFLSAIESVPAPDLQHMADRHNDITRRLNALDDAIGPDQVPDPAARAREILALRTSHEQLLALAGEPPEVFAAVVAEIRNPAP